MLTVFLATLPFFLLLGVGVVAGTTERFATAEPAINAFVFWVALPAFLFDGIAKTDPSAGVPLPVVLISVGLTSLVCIAAYVLGRVVPGLRRLGAAPFSMVSGYGNVGYLGIPIVITLAGGGSVLAAGIVSLLHNLLFMVGYPFVRTVVEHHRDEGTSGLPVGRILKSAILANPVALSIGAGLAVALWHPPIPHVLDVSIAMMGQAAVPGAMFAIGLTLRPAFAEIRRGGVPPVALAGATLIKMAVLPALTLLAVRALGDALPVPWDRSLVIMAAMPVSATAFLLARTYDDESAGHFAAATIVTTSVAAVVVVPLFAAAAGA